MRHRILRKPQLVAALVVAMLAGAIVAATSSATSAAPNDNRYTVHNLVSDGSIPADHTDPNLVNAWGIAASSSSPWWVANNHTDTSTLYEATGTPFPATPLVVNVAGDPTGTVFNGGSGFVVTDGTNSGAARFLFATEGGTIRGWSPAVPPPPLSTQTELGASHAGAIYKGLAIASTPSGDRLYATDFHHGAVDVYDSSFSPVSLPGGFVDPTIPSGFAPFGIQAIGGNIFVSYAKQDGDAVDEVGGQGLGFVDEYSTSGDLITRVAQHGRLNAPWGMAMAPSDFGKFSGDLLVGNFGDGTINAYEPAGNGHFLPRGTLRVTDGNSLVVDGLWGIGFGNGGVAGQKNVLYFAAGPEDETEGLFGSISFTP